MDEEKNQGDNPSPKNKGRKEFWSREDMENAKPYPMPEPIDDSKKKHKKEDSCK